MPQQFKMCRCHLSVLVDLLAYWLERDHIIVCSTPNNDNPTITAQFICFIERKVVIKIAHDGEGHILWFPHLPYPISGYIFHRLFWLELWSHIQ